MIAQRDVIRSAHRFSESSLKLVRTYRMGAIWAQYLMVGGYWGDLPAIVNHQLLPT